MFFSLMNIVFQVCKWDYGGRGGREQHKHHGRKTEEMLLPYARFGLRSGGRKCLLGASIKPKQNPKLV
jgi:hypothetical protein